MTQRDDQVYVWHMLDTANKAIGFVQGLTRDDFDNSQLLRLSLTHFLQVLSEAARRVSQTFEPRILRLLAEALAQRVLGQVRDRLRSKCFA